MTLRQLVVGLRSARTQHLVESSFEPEALFASIALQGRDLQSAWRHELANQTLERRLAELLCDLVHLSDELGMDVDGAIRWYLARYRPPVDRAHDLQA